MNKSDHSLCTRVLSPGREIGRLKLMAVQRAGALLLALPMNRALALATLDLYQPQKLKGRVFRHLLRWIVKCGLHQRASKIEFILGDKGLFSGLGKVTDFQELGFLLSGADSEHRNLIGLCEIDGQQMVVKAGCNEAARIVTQEYNLQCKLAEQIQGVPACKAFFEIDGGVAYVTEFIYGRSPKGPKGDAVAFTLLNRWLDVGALRRVNSLGDWSGLKNCLDENEKEYFTTLDDLEVVSPAVHGDFAPWNIKIDTYGDIKVLDWEYASPSGMPGWDWLHYHVQRLKLVDGESADRILAHCRDLMIESSFADYLAKAGLKGYEESLLGSYLFYTGRYYSYPREEEIQLWLATK